MCELTLFKVVGHVREFQEKRSILAFKILVVTDPQEAVYHNLLATYVHLYHRFGPLPEGGAAGAPGELAGASSAYQAPAAHHGHAAAGPSSGAAELQKAVMAYVKSTTGSSGAAKADIEKALKHLASVDAIDAAIEHLCMEGALYSTIDDSHYKSSL